MIGLLARPSSSWATRLVLLAALAATSGCARLVTVDPDVAAERNDVAWKIRSLPAPPGAPVPGSTPASPAPGVQEAAAREAGPAPAASAPVEPVPFRQRPEIARALLSPADRRGIPADLYAVDPLLSAHRREMEARASSLHAVAGGAIVLGLLAGAVGVWAVSVGVSHQNDPPPAQNSSSQAIVWGSLSCVLALGELVAGTVLAFSGADERPIQRYYRETYTDPR